MAPEPDASVCLSVLFSGPFGPFNLPSAAAAAGAATSEPYNLAHGAAPPAAGAYRGNVSTQCPEIGTVLGCQSGKFEPQRQ